MCREVVVMRRLTRVLDDLALPYQVIPSASRELPQGPRDTAYCVDSMTASELPRIWGPTIVVLTGARVSDTIVRRTYASCVSTVSLQELEGPSLLRAMITATTGQDLDGLMRRLCKLALFSQVDRQIVAAFLEDPQRLTRLADLRRRVLLSREAAQARVRACGFRRAEHLFTALRVATWVMLREMGIHREQVEAYLGIENRGSLRRACRRAGVPSLSRNLRMDMLVSRMDMLVSRDVDA